MSKKRLKTRALRRKKANRAKPSYEEVMRDRKHVMKMGFLALLSKGILLLLLIMMLLIVVEIWWTRGAASDSSTQSIAALADWGAL